MLLLPFILIFLFIVSFLNILGYFSLKKQALPKRAPTFNLVFGIFGFVSMVIFAIGGIKMVEVLRITTFVFCIVLLIYKVRELAKDKNGIRNSELLVTIALLVWLLYILR